MPKEQRDIILKVGETAVLKTGFMSKTVLIFAGKSDKDMYSLVVSYTTGNNSLAYNLYYPSSRRNVTLSGRLLEILSVTPDELRLNIVDARKHNSYP